MFKTHFKRQGSAGLLILQDIPKNYHVEYDHDRGYLKVVELWEVPRIWNHKTYYETHSKIILSKNYTITHDSKENFTNIRDDINKVIACEIEIENYIESYYIGAQAGDRDILNGIDITEKTVMEVLVKCRINLVEFFSPWKRESLTEVLQNPSKKLLEQKFSDLYSFIHWYDIDSHKKQIEEFKNVICI